MNTKPETSTAGEVLINNREDLRRALSMSAAADIPEVGESFRATRAELDSLVTEWVQNGVPTPEQMARIREFVTKKTAAIKEAQKGADKLREQVGAAVAPTAVLSGAAEAVGPDARQVIADLGIADDVRDGINEMIEEDPNATGFDKIIGKFLKKFMTMIAGIFGIQLDKKDEKAVAGNGGNERSGQWNKQEKARENIDRTVFFAAARGIVRLYPEQDRKNYPMEVQKNAPTTLVNIGDMSYRDIQDRFKQSDDISTLSSRFGLKDTDPKELELSIKALMAQHDHFASFFARSPHPVDWEGLSISKLVSEAGVEFSELAKIEAIQTEEDAKAWLKELAQPIGPDMLNSNGGLQVKFRQIQERCAGFDMDLIAKILPLNATSISGDTLERQGFSLEQQAFIKTKLMPFRENLLASLDDSRINFGMDAGKLKGVFSGEKGVLGMGDVLNIFIRTGGHLNFSEMNSFEHCMYYQTIAAYLWKKDKEVASGYLTRIARAWLSGDMPPETQKMFGVLANASSEVMEYYLREMFNISAGVLKELPSEAYLALIAAGAAFFYLIRPFVVLKAATVVAGASTVALFALAGSMVSNPEVKDALKKAEMGM